MRQNIVHPLPSTSNGRRSNIKKIEEFYINLEGDGKDSDGVIVQSG